MGSHPGCSLGSTLPLALSSRLFSGSLAELLLSENTFLFLLTQYFWGKKNGLLFLFRNMIETHRRQSRGLSGNAPSSFLCAGPAACLRSGSWRRANET